jgi:ABC-type xylose transport system permease subunit
MFNKADIEKYFAGEKSESLLFLSIGIAAIATAIVFFFALKTNFYKGAAIPLILVGLMMGIVGFTVYKRSDPDRIRNTYAYDMNPQELKTKELPRMQTVMKSFVVYRWVEIILAITGLGLFFYFRNNANQTFWKGLGLALAIIAVIGLAADYFAEARGKIYTRGLQEFTSKMGRGA